MRDTLRLLGIIALAVIIGFSMVACDNGSTTDTGDKTPVVGDYSISGDGNKTYTGEPIAVTVTAKGGASPGAVTVLYNGNPTAPKDTGSYSITFNVAAATGWKAVDGLSGGWILIISNTGNKPIPTAMDFEYNGREQTWTGQPKRLGIVPKAGKSSGVIAIYYNNSLTEPINEGIYTVTFDVGATDTYQSASGLQALVDLVITPALGATIVPVPEDFHIIGIGNYPADGSKRYVYVIPRTGKSEGNTTVYYNGKTEQPTEIGQYHITFDVTASGPYTAAQGLDGGWLYIDGKEVEESFFVVSGLSQVYDGTPKSVKVVPKAEHQVLTALVKYQAANGVPVSNPPYQAGEYEVWYDVPKALGYAATGDSLYAGKLVIGPSTGTTAPTFNDFTVEGLGNYTFDDTMRRIVTVKQNVDGGVITVYYQSVGGSPGEVAPKNAGTYDVSLYVGASRANGPATIQLGRVTIYAVLPVLSDFNIDNSVWNYDGQSKSVTITSNKLGDISGYLDTRYEGIQTLPSNAGKYNVIFNLTASTNWQAVSGFEAGIMEIKPGVPKLADFDVKLPENKIYDKKKLDDPVVTNKTNTGYPVSNGAKTYTFNGAAIAENAAEYEVVLKLGETDNWVALDLPLGKVTIEARTPAIEDFKTVQGISLQQTAYLFDPATFPTKLFMADPDRDVAYPANTNLPNVSYIYNGRGTQFANIKNAGPGTYTIRLAVPAVAPNWIAKTLDFDLKVGDIVFSDAQGFVDWYNALTTKGPFRASFEEEALIAGDLALIAAALKNGPPGPGDTDTIDNTGQLIYLDFTKAYATSVITTIAGAFDGCQNLIGVNFTGVPSIGASGMDADTFKGCVNLEEIIFPDTGLTTLTPATALQDCVKLKVLDTGALTAITKANLTGTVTGNGGKVFDIEKLTLRAANITTGVAASGTAAFTGMKSLKTLIVGIETAGASIAVDAFKECVQLESVVFPKEYGVSVINAGAFEGCVKLASVTFPEKTWTGLTADASIGDGAFKDCSSLTNLNIPILSVADTTIHANAFKNAGLKTITLGNGAASSIGAAALTDDIFKNQKNLETVTLNVGVPSLPGGAFEGCSNLSSVSFPASGFGNIGANAFEGCSKLTSVDLTNVGGSTPVIGIRAFRGCTALADITLPTAGGFDTVSAGAFYGTAIKSIKLVDAVLTIGGSSADGGAFENCKSLASVDYGNAVATIGDNAFAGCTSLKEFIVDPDVADNKGKVNLNVIASYSFGTGVFKGCTSIDYLKINVTSAAGTITGGSFADCSNIKTLEVIGSALPTGLTFGGSGNNVPSITKIIWASTGTGITSAINFTGCTGLETLSVGAMSVAVDSGAFSTANSKFTTLEINGNVAEEDIDYFADLPDTVVNIIVGAPPNNAAGYNIGLYDSTGTKIFNPKVRYIEFTGNIGVIDALTFAGLGLTGNGGPITLKINAAPGTTFAAAANPIGTVIIGEKTPLIADGTAFPITTLKEFIVLPGNVTMATYGGALYQKNTSGALNKLIQYPLANEATTYAIPLGVEEIGAGAFGVNTHIRELTIPTTVKTISTNAYSAIADSSDANYKLTVNYNAISATSASLLPITMTTLNIGDQVKFIPATFLGTTTPITKLTIPASVTNIGAGAISTLAATGALTDVVFKAVDYQSTNTSLFNGITTIVSVTIEDGVTAVRNAMFSGCTGLTYVSLPNTITSIETNAFNGCTSLNRIAIPPNVITIADTAFGGCNALGEVIFKGATTGIAANTSFADGTTLKTAYTAGGAGWYKKVATAWSKFSDAISFD
jgi:hypothetical protein